MSMQERGVYITLICQCWIEGAIPADIARLARLCGLPLTTFRKIWPSLAGCFRPSRRDAEQLVHPRLERERVKQAEWRAEQSERGKSGAAARWRKHGAAMPTPSRKNGVAMISPMASAMPNHASLSLSASSSSSSDCSQQRQPPNARSKRPIYQSDRFVVFDWQFDDLSKMLGPHFEAFGLDEFFDALSQQSRASGLVIPKSEAWPWLQAQVLAEAQRRGLPMASAAPAAIDRKAKERAQDEQLLAEIQQDKRYAGR
jgi:uncharacterized protein YdaU (DUF1376 family)